MEIEKEKDVQIHVDYLSFTFPLKNSIDPMNAFELLKEDIANLFYMTSFNYGILNDWAQDNYRYQLSLGEHIVVRFGGLTTMMKAVEDLENGMKSHDKYESCMVELKGQACREIEKISGGNVDYIKIIDWFLSHGGKCNRLDLAIDDCKGDIITLKTVLKVVSKGLYTSSFKGNPEVFMGAIDGLDDKGTSLYFGKSIGKRKNNLELCIYDKKAERKFNNDTFSGEYWTRYELRFRNEGSQNLAYFICKTKLEDIGNFACEQLKRILTLKCKKINGKKTNDNNVSRYDNLPAWDKFLNVVKGTRFSMLKKLESTLEKKIKWRSYSLTRQNIILDFADVYNNASKEWVDPACARIHTELLEMLSYLKENKNKIQQKDIEMINNYLSKEKNMIPLDFNNLNQYIIDLEERIEWFEKRFKLPF